MSTVIIRPLPGERRVSYSAAWFVPVDLVTGSPPSLPLRVLLDIHDGQGWVPTGIEPAITLSGAVGYPDLGRCREPGGRRTQAVPGPVRVGRLPGALAAPTGTARNSSPTRSTTPPRQRRTPPG